MLQQNEPINGIIVINKPSGITSFDVVAKVRKAFGQKKVGHAGTLDPDVSGVLVVALGKATKLIDELQARPKKYEGEITLGFSTETEDASGAIVENKPIIEPFADAEIDQAIRDLNGNIKQVPPMFSAVKVNGKRLYEYARAGETVTRPVRDAIIYNYQRTSDITYSQQRQIFNFEATVSKGTYIRTLAVDTGKKLQIPATMTKLKRIMGSGMTLDKACDFDAIVTGNRDSLLNLVIPIPDILTWPSKELSADEWFAVKNGQKIASFDEESDLIQLTYKGELKAVYAYHAESNDWQSRYVFSNN